MPSQPALHLDSPCLLMPKDQSSLRNPLPTARLGTRGLKRKEPFLPKAMARRFPRCGRTFPFGRIECVIILNNIDAKNEKAEDPKPGRVRLGAARGGQKVETTKERAAYGRGALFYASNKLRGRGEQYPSYVTQLQFVTKLCRRDPDTVERRRQRRVGKGHYECEPSPYRSMLTHVNNSRGTAYLNNR